MEVRPGYKQTDVGVIPEDWEAAALGVIAGLDVGYAFSSAWFQKHDGVPLLRGENVGYGRPNWSDTRRLAVTHAGAFGEYRLRPGDVVIGMDRTFTKSGTKISLVRDGDCPCLLVQRVGRFIPKRCDGGFLWGVLSSARFRQSLLAEQKGMDIPHLSRAEILRPLVAFPTRATEREAIAEALSDADALIESLEQILAKKRQIKQGAMQELLSGRKRLPEFEGNREYKQTAAGVLPTDWNAGPIGRAIEKLEAGASVNSEKDEAPEFESYPCVLKTGAASGGLFHPRESKRVAGRDLWRLKVSVRRDTILISRMNTTELVGESGYVPCDYRNLFVPDRMWMATVRSTVSPRWLSYILTWRPVKSQISASATGTSGSMKNISKPSLRVVEIPYPPVEEQCAIAKVLSDFETEITNLAAKLVKASQIKQGMMQELLTGRIRLV